MTRTTAYLSALYFHELPQMSMTPLSLICQPGEPFSGASRIKMEVAKIVLQILEYICFKPILTNFFS